MIGAVNHIFYGNYGGDVGYSGVGVVGRGWATNRWYFDKFDFFRSSSFLFHCIVAGVTTSTTTTGGTTFEIALFMTTMVGVTSDIVGTTGMTTIITLS